MKILHVLAVAAVAAGVPSKRRWVLPVIVIMTLAILTALGAIAPSPSSAQPAMTGRDALGSGQQAYAYFYPIAANAVAAPLAGPGRRNEGTQHAVAWLDLTGGPLVVSALDTGRHYVVPMLDRWTRVVASPGARMTGTRADEFLVALPSWQGPLPAGIARVDSPTPHVWIIGHIDTDASLADGGVRRTPGGYRIAPLSEWARDRAQITIDIASVLNTRSLPRTQAGTCPGTNASRMDQRC